MAGSELAKLRGKIDGPCLIGVGARARRPRHGAGAGQLRRAASAHDIAEGGLAVALAECCVAGQIGATVRLPDGIEPFAEARDGRSSSPGQSRPSAA